MIFHKKSGDLYSKEEVIEVLDKFLNREDEIGPFEWDDFLSLRGRDTELNAIRDICSAVSEAFPANPSSGMYCSTGGVRLLQGLLDILREESAS